VSEATLDIDNGIDNILSTCMVPMLRHSPIVSGIICKALSKRMVLLRGISAICNVIRRLNI